MTWAAIYRLKEQEKELNDKMEDEMRKIQEKYDELKNPLIKKISKVVVGEPVEK